MKFRLFKKRSNYRKRKTAKKNKKLATIGTVKKLIGKNLEHKIYPEWFDNAAIGAVTATTVVNLCNPGQGLTDANRIGDTIKFKDILLHYQIRSDATAIFDRNVRVMVIQWHEQGATFTMGNILMDATAGDRAILSPINHDENNRFTVLYDKVHLLGVGPSTLAGALPTLIHKKVRLTPARKISQFIAGGTTYASNRLYLLYFAGSVTTNPVMSFQALTTYTDA